MTDPTDALISFQQALLDGELQLQRGARDPELAVYHDKPQGIPRWTYAHLDRKTVTALAIAVVGDPIAGIPCFEWAWPSPKPTASKGAPRRLSRRPLQS